MAKLQMQKSCTDRRDPSIEQWLKGFGITDARLQMVPLDNIDAKKSRANQARIEPLSDEHVDRLRVAHQAGAVFPPLIASEELVLLDGNHRHEALLREGVTEHPVYVVPVGRQLFIDMAAAANALNGQPNTPEERRLHAVQLNDTNTYTFTQIAAMVGLSVTQVSDAVHASSVRKRIGSNGAVGRVPSTTLAMLDQIPADGPLRAAVEAVDASNAGQVATRALVKKLKRARSEPSAYKAIDAFAKEQTEARKARRSPAGNKSNDLAQLRRAITTLRSVNPTKVAMEANGSRDSLIHDLAESVEKLGEIESAL